MRFKAIFFDLDDTLYDLRRYRVARLREALAGVVERYPQFVGDDLVQAALAEGVFTEQFSDFLRRRGVDEVVIAAAQQVFQDRWFEGMLLAADAVPTLEVLRFRYHLGLITNGPAWAQRRKIERFALARYMEVVIVSEEVGVAKPDPAIFLLALRQLSLVPSEALFVGDSPGFDIEGAAAVGMPSVWMNPRREPLPDGVPAPLAVIEQLASLPALLEELGR